MRQRILEVNIEIQHIVDWIKEYFVKNGNKDTKAVIGMSGGKDSTIAATLLVRALGADRVVGVLMPNDYQADIEEAQDICDYLGIKWYEIDIGPTYRTLCRDFAELTDLEVDSRIETNTPARLRMTTLYMVAAAVGGRVCCTDNASESYIGYSTKYGDLAGDFAPLRDYYVREVLAIGEGLGLAQRWVYKTPTDGMCGKTDEENIGLTYAEMDAYNLDGVTPSYDKLRIMTDMHNRNRHKNAINLPGPRPKTRHWNDKDYIPEDWCEF